MTVESLLLVAAGKTLGMMFVRTYPSAWKVEKVKKGIKVTKKSDITKHAEKC